MAGIPDFGNSHILNPDQGGFTVFELIDQRLGLIQNAVTHQVAFDIVDAHGPFFRAADAAMQQTITGGLCHAQILKACGVEAYGVDQSTGRSLIFGACQRQRLLQLETGRLIQSGKSICSSSSISNKVWLLPGLAARVKIKGSGADSRLAALILAAICEDAYL